MLVIAKNSYLGHSQGAKCLSFKMAFGLHESIVCKKPWLLWDWFSRLEAEVPEAVCRLFVYMIIIHLFDFFSLHLNRLALSFFTVVSQSIVFIARVYISPFDSTLYFSKCTNNSEMKCFIPASMCHFTSAYLWPF